MSPTRSYLICTTPRSGSTLLAEALRATTVAGVPQEYFQELPSTLQPATPRDYVGLVADPVVREVLTGPGATLHAQGSSWPSRFPSWGEYLESVIQEGTTVSTRMFAVKVMWRYFGGLLLRLRDEYGPGRDEELIARAFGTPRFVYLQRRDKVAQAISLWRAIQTWSWRADDGRADSAELVYSFAAIGHLIRRLELDDADWERWFSGISVEPFRVEYEELAADYLGVTASVLRHVGVENGTKLAGSPPLRRQADELSESWATRYREEAGDTAPSGAR